MFKLAVALALVAATYAVSDFDTLMDSDFSVMNINKDMQWSECTSKTFATVFDSGTYGTDKTNVAKYCAHYCRNFVDDDTTHVNLDDRTTLGGAYACYCSSDCSAMCDGTPSYETVTVSSTSTVYEPIAYYYNTYYYSSYWVFPYEDDSQYGRSYYFSYTGPSSGYNMYWYYYFGTQEGSNSFTLNGNDYVSYWNEGTEDEAVDLTVWTMNCDSGDDMDFVNEAMADMTADYNVIMSDADDDVDFSSLTYQEALDMNAAMTQDPLCMPAKIFQYGTMSHGYTWPNQLDYVSDSDYVYGMDATVVNGVKDICAIHTDQDTCEGYKVYSYGGYTCSTDDTDAYTTSENFGYSYYYDGTSVYHGDSSNCFEFDWQLQDQGMYGTTFTYYYYYYYSYVYICDWTYDYEVDTSNEIHNMVFAEFSLYAILDN